MSKLHVDIKALMGDLIGDEGIYIYFVSCNEYALWYLIRHAGIMDFVNILGTRNFLTDGPILQLENISLYQQENLGIIIQNLEKFSGIKIKQYTRAEYPELSSFIKEAVDSRRLAYTLYDYYFDRLAATPAKRFHDYHGHVITGYDDSRRLYSSLVPGKYEVSYEDLEIMAAHCLRKNGTFRDYYFYILPTSDLQAAATFDQWRQMPEIRELLAQDCSRMLRDWETEILLFQRYLEDIALINGVLPDKLRENALRQRLFFKSITEGMHGNFLLKLRFIADYLQADTSQLYGKFFANRDRCVLISNMYRKAVVLLDEDFQLYTQILARIREKVELYFIRESRELLESFRLFALERRLIDQ